MAGNNQKALGSQLKFLLENEPELFKQWLLSESAKLENPGKLKLISALFSSGVLGSTSNDGEAISIMVKGMLELAVTICCSKGGHAAEGLLKSLEEVDSPALISDLRKLVKDNFGFNADDDLSEAMGDLSVGGEQASGESLNAAGMNPDDGAAQVDAGQVGPLPDGSDPIEQVFGNALIWKIVGSYLNLGDLKACRLVSSRFHGMVMKETSFLRRCLVSLKPHQITRNHFGSTKEPWRNVLLKFGNPGPRCDHEELEWLYPLLLNVESLSLRMEEGSIGLEFHPVFKRLLNAPNKLRALAIEPIFLTGDTTESHLWKDPLENLEEFQILQPPLGWLLQLQPSLGWLSLCKLTAVVLLESKKLLKEMNKIQIFKIYDLDLPLSEYRRRNAVVTPEEDRVLSSELLGLTSVIANIVWNNGNTLKQVMLPRRGFIRLDGLGARSFPCFPSLESATFYNFDFRTCEASKYLLPLPMLKELEFSVRSALPITVLNAIGARSDCLRKLKLKSSGFTDANWQFLKKTEMREFQLELIELQDEEEATLPDEALNCLPLTLRRLSLRGSLESTPIPALSRLNPSLVTQLTFINSGDCFTDDLMRYIVGSLKMLRKLNVTNAKRLTDAGFVGSSSESGSLSGIKGLRKLILRECGSMTDATLREIRFLELHYLDLSYNEQLTEGGLEGLLRTNPSLETLLMSCENFYRRKEQMYASHPRLSDISL